MISIRDAERIHNILIEKFGGLKGIRDSALLDSALKRPFQTLSMEDGYSSL